VVGFLILSNLTEITAWRWMYATAIIPAILVVLGRLEISDSGPWLMSQGRKAEAEAEVARLLEREPPYPKEVRLADLPADAQAAALRVRRNGGWRELFTSPGRRATILASVPWFLQDLGTYGIGIFTPTIVARTIGHEDTAAHNIAALMARDILAAKGAALLDVLLIVGILAAVLLADRVGRIRLQVVGFIGCAAGLGLSDPVAAGGRADAQRAAVRRLHAVQLHDQRRTQRPDLPAGGRGLSHRDPRQGRGLCRGLRQGRRGADGVPVPGAAGRHRRPLPAERADRKLAARRLGDLAVPHRDDRHQPGEDRPLIPM
jgi:hypothetical protein